MLMRAKKPKLELAACAQALQNTTIESSISRLEELIEEGNLHLAELREAVHCNPLQINALAHRIDRAEELLKRKIMLSEKR